MTDYLVRIPANLLGHVVYEVLCDPAPDFKKRIYRDGAILIVELQAGEAETIKLGDIAHFAAKLPALTLVQHVEVWRAAHALYITNPGIKP